MTIWNHLLPNPLNGRMFSLNSNFKIFSFFFHLCMKYITMCNKKQTRFIAFNLMPSKLVRNIYHCTFSWRIMFSRQLTKSQLLQKPYENNHYHDNKFYLKTLILFKNIYFPICFGLKIILWKTKYVAYHMLLFKTMKTLKCWWHMLPNWQNAGHLLCLVTFLYYVYIIYNNKSWIQWKK